MAQYNLSKELWSLLKKKNKNPTTDEIFALADYILNREVDWIEKSQERISKVVYKTTPSIDGMTAGLRVAFEQATRAKWQEAAETIESVVAQETDEKTKGYLMQIKAEYTNFFDCSQAHEILRLARNFNGGTIEPKNKI